ncbi:LysR family transcriptional regulator [Rhodoplanes sp. Z2-YC6860]|uniref:LysR family transcriptional regulator n=1 Tax=Rhodoplanes sp. Z2-YC6860 TaxID=674703 RepID=UPI00078CB25A|nr:LysR family transcriptional regulator [Rhodoplanes sp. Z2-YC6860]AMN38558.1 LysR family transcriptional regulator [Rhodoplanes sp. Z2-YC6860]
MNIDKTDLRKVDLNLLVAFQVLVREKSVSRAAERLFLGQPAMSGALARLREIMQDEILVRTGRGMEPTAKALALYEQLAPALESIRTTLFARPVFDPATQSRTFHLGMRDWVESWLMPALLERIQTAAPQVRIAVRASDAQQGARMLDSDEMDLGVSVFPDGPAWQRREQLAAMGYRCVYDGKRLGLRSRLTLEQYLAHPHLVTPTQSDFRGPVDDELIGSSKRRNVIYATSRFAALPLILRRAAVIATVPEQSARQWADVFGLTSSPVPVRIAPFAISMIWHAKRDSDAGLQWLRAVVRDVVTSEMSNMSKADASKAGTPARNRRRRASL